MTSNNSKYAVLQAEHTTLQQENQRLQEEIAAAKQEAARFRSLVEETEDLIIEVNASGLLTYVNARVERVFGQSAADCIGTLLFERIHPDDRERIQQTFTTWSQSQKRSASLEGRFLSQTGDVYHMHWAITCFYNEQGALTTINAICRDISSIKGSSDAAQYRQTMPQEVLDNLPSATYVTDIAGRILFVNQQWSAAVNIPAEQAVGLLNTELFGPDVLEGWAEIINTIRETGQPITRAEQFEHPDGLHTYLSTRFPIYNTDGVLYAIGGISTDITYWKRTEETMQRLAAIVENSSDFIGTASFEGVPFYVNPAGVRMTGLNSLEEVQKHHINDFFPPEEQAFSNEVILPAVMRDGLWEGEFRFRNIHTDEPIPVHYTLFVVRDPQTGEPLGVATITRDISERKRQEEALHVYKSAVENAVDGLVMIDMDGVVVYTNEAQKRLTGYGEDTIGMQATEFFTPEDAIRVQNEIIPTIIEQGSWQGTIPVVRPDQSVWLAQATGYLLKDAQEQIIGIVGIFRDITDQQKQQEELQLARFALENAADTVSWYDQSGQLLYLNTAGFRLYGYEPADLPHLKAIDIDPAFTPDLLERLTERLRREGSILIEREHRHKDGHLIQVEATNNYVVFNDEEYICVIIRDITERKRQEAELQTFKRIADNAPDGLGVSTPDGAILYANEAYCTLTGYGEALVGMNFADHFAEADLPLALEGLTTTATEGYWQGILNFKRKDGTIVHVDTTGFVLRDETGKIISLMGLFRDMTEQQKAEAERAALQQQVIEAQNATLRELSTPLIPISDDVVIMPLIGAIDSLRAQQVLETLLEGVGHHRARLAILDITGVSIVDTQVAQSFISAAQAVKLLGAEVMITGIQPQIAQTLVHLGVDLGGIGTRGSLQAGIAAALRNHQPS